MEKKNDLEEVEVETEETERERGGVAVQETDPAEVVHVTEVKERGEEVGVETEAGGVHANAKLRKPVVWVTERCQKWTMA